MSYDFRINYIYMRPETKERFDQACEEIGWALRTQAVQCLKAFSREHKDYYISCALMDAEARGMTQEEYYRVLRDEGADKLKSYIDMRPGFPPTPLDRIPPIDEIRQKYNKVSLTGYNLVLLRVAQIVDRGTMIQLVSRIIEYHFQKYWDLVYAPQIRLNQLCRFTPPEADI